MTDLLIFDKIIRSVANKVWSLPRETASDVVHLPKSILGVGIPYMLTSIAPKLTINLTDSLADNSILGYLIRNQRDHKSQTRQGLALTTATWNAFSEFPIIRLVPLLS